MTTDPLLKPNREIVFEILADTNFIDSSFRDMDDFYRAMEIYDMLDDGKSMACTIARQLITIADAVARSCPDKLRTYSAHNKMMQMAQAGYDAFDEHAYKNEWPKRSSVFINPISTNKIICKKT